MPQLSIIIPVYNEARTIKEILNRINSVEIDKEIIVVDDGSTDGTDKVLRGIKFENLKIIYHSSNRGKGSAFLTGLANASGEFVIIQDADLEYDPCDYPKLMNTIKRDNAEIILGARFIKGYNGLFLHRLGNRFLTGLINLLFNTNLNDSFSCYKLMPRSVFNKLDIKSKGFDLEAEIITKAIKNKLRITQVPISYHPRSYSEGKKIRWKDGIQAILSILRYRFSS